MDCQRIDGPTSVCRTHGALMMGDSPYCVAALARRIPPSGQSVDIPSNFVVLQSRIESEVDSGHRITLRFGHRDLSRLDLDGATRERLERQLVDVTVYPGTLDTIRAELDALKSAR